MDYAEISIIVPADRVEAAADALRAATGSDVSIEAPFVQADLESDAIIVAAAPRLVRAYVAAANAGVLESGVADALAAAGVRAAPCWSPVSEEDWAESWKRYFDVERYGERIVVVPSWRDYVERAGDLVITLDPGMAFGTGQHETTRMCIEALERVVAPGMNVLDAGCGSGILSLVAARLGARHVLALDIDENCVRVAAENARTNGLSDAISARRGDVAALGETDAGTGFDVIVANIAASVIIGSAGDLVRRLAPGGWLIVSGVIGERESETCRALEAAGARIERVRSTGDWRCIEARRNTRATA